MFDSRRMEKRMKSIYERALHFIYLSNSKLTFKELLDKNKLWASNKKTYER